MDVWINNMALIGIDLGTTNSVCGIWQSENFTMIPNRLGEFLTPSVVSLDENGTISIGKSAKERLIQHPDKTVACFKRLMGSKHEVSIANRNFSPTELSAMIIKSLKEDAEQHLSVPIEEAVISVPAYFSENQRFATKQAAEMVGLKVSCLINEPTAAAIAYGLNEKREGTFLVLDLGGGTFDVSILEFFDGIMEVHASAGDNFLGGEDFTDAMVEGVLHQCQLQLNELTAIQAQLLTKQMESLKRQIVPNKQFSITFSSNKGEHNVELDEAWFNGIITPLLLKIKKPIQQAMSDSQLSQSDIDEIVLVGGATKLPHFRSFISKLFGRIPSGHIDPDTVVARGASIQAALKARDESLEDVVLTDVCPYTLGTGIINKQTPEKGNYFFPIIDRNATVPTSIVKRLYTTVDQQEKIKVEIYQGESRFVVENVYLGELNTEVPPKPAGQESIDVRYSYDVNGLLDVDIKVISTGKTQSLTIEQAPGALTEEQLQAAKAKLEKIKQHPREHEKNQMLLAKGERLFQSTVGEQREYIGFLLNEFEQTLNKQNQLEILKKQEQLEQAFAQIDNSDWL